VSGRAAPPADVAVAQARGRARRRLLVGRGETPGTRSGTIRRGRPGLAGRLRPDSPLRVRRARDRLVAGPTSADRFRAAGRRPRAGAAGLRPEALRPALVPPPAAARHAATRRRARGPAPTGGAHRVRAGEPSPTRTCGAISPAGDGRPVRYGAVMGDALDVDAMIQRFRDRAHAVRSRTLPPVAGEERMQFIRQAEVDFQDFAIIGDAEATVENGVLVLRVDLRPKDDAGAASPS
jgi:hypothetical protein